LRFGDDEVQEAGLGANRAIAVLADNALGGLDLELDRFAMATTTVEHGFRLMKKNADIVDRHDRL
jgi:hypothetical protein